MSKADFDRAIAKFKAITQVVTGDGLVEYVDPFELNEDIVQAHYSEVKRLVEKKSPSGRFRGTLYSGGEYGYGYGDGDVPLVDSDKVKSPNGGIFVGRPNTDILGQFSGYVLNKA